jgi:hypothetical protein
MAEILFIEGSSAGETSGSPSILNASQFDSPVSADWAVNALAPASADSNNAGLTVRLFDDTAEEGVGFQETVPAAATSMVLQIKSRAETAPGGAEAVVPRLYFRAIPNDGAVAAWSGGFDLTPIDIPTNENFQYDMEAITLAALGLTAGSLFQFELTRNTGAGGDTLTGDWDLLELQVSFA